MNQESKTRIAVVVVSVALVYLVASFVAFDLNPRNWELFGRLLSIFLAVLMVSAGLKEYD